MFRILARLKRLRGTPLDLFGRTAERQMERRLITQYESDLALLAQQSDLSGDRLDAAVALAELPLQIRGFGPVKQKNEANAAKRREELLAVLQQSSQPKAAAE